MPIAKLADLVGLSQTPCWRRVQNLEKTGVIRSRVALLERHAMNVGVTVFVSVRPQERLSERLLDLPPPRS